MKGDETLQNQNKLPADDDNQVTNASLSPPPGNHGRKVDDLNEQPSPTTSTSQQSEEFSREQLECVTHYPIRRYPERERRPPLRYEASKLMRTTRLVPEKVDVPPESISDALSRVDAEHWRNAVEEELKTLEVIQTWKKVKVPSGIRISQSKFIFVMKKLADGRLDK